jgi:septal ring factor EnvC (AmiA/AmiB activator)
MKPLFLKYVKGIQNEQEGRDNCMKRLMILLLVLSTMMLSACSFLQEANNSLQYVDQATEHINTLTNFAEQAPQMIQDAATNPETKQKLEDQLMSLKKEIEQFNLIDAPSIAKDLHQQLVDKNKELLQEINQALANGHLALDQLQNSQIITTINNIISFQNRIENLGL